MRHDDGGVGGSAGDSVGGTHTVGRVASSFGVFTNWRLASLCPTLCRSIVDLHIRPGPSVCEICWITIIVLVLG